MVSGEIRKMEGEYYFIKDDETGNEARLLVNKDANLDCSAAPIAIPGTTSQVSQQSDSQENSRPLRPATGRKTRDKSRIKRP